MGITHDEKDGHIEILAYMDADHATSLDARRSTIGGGRSHIAGFRNRLLVFEDAASEGAVSHRIGIHGHERGREGSGGSTPDGTFVRPEMQEYFVKVVEDNERVIKHRTKPIDVRHHFLRQHVQENNIKIIHVGTEDPHACSLETFHC